MVNPFKDSGAATPALEPEPVKLFGVPYRPQVYPELVFKYCLLGATDLQLCDLMDISHDTLAQWRKQHPLFNRSIVEGRAMADAEVAHSLYQCAKGYTREEVKIFQYRGVPIVVPYEHYYAPDVRAATYWLSLRQKDRWSQPQAIDVQARTVVETKVISADATPEQAAELYKSMLG